MDEKHKMLYPPINPNGAASSSASSTAAPTAGQIKSATAELGLPSEPPPTYDFAMASSSTVPPVAVPPQVTAPAASNSNAHWTVSAPITASEAITHQAHAFAPTLPVIVEQPMQPPYSTQSYQQYPTQPQQHNEPKQQQPQYQQTHNYQPQYQQHTATVPTTSITAPPPHLGPNPCKVTCPACGANKTTRMCFTPNSRTHICALFLCLVGWCCCACCVPYCMTSCRTGNHYCAKCNTFLGAYIPNQRK